MSEFTKGPWKAGINYVPYEYDYCWIEIPKGPTISLSPAKENEANAHLIAAAPDMHEALEKCVESLVRYKSCLHGYAKESAHNGKRDNQEFWTTRVKHTQDLQDEVAKVLKKAKGESE